MKQLLIMLCAGAFISCGPSTSMVKSWHEPGTTISQSGSQKALIIAMVKDESSRRMVEDNLAKRMNGKGVPSYLTLTEDMLKSASDEALEKKIVDGGFSHVLMVRLADVEKETSYVPGTTTAYYGGYRRFYGYGAGAYSSPGYYTEDKNYFVETTLYSINPDKLLWTGTTKTVNPTKMEKTINAMADAVVDQMIKDGFLVK